MIEGLKPYAEYKESGLPWLANYKARSRVLQKIREQLEGLEDF